MKMNLIYDVQLFLPSVNYGNEHIQTKAQMRIFIICLQVVIQFKVGVLCDFQPESYWGQVLSIVTCGS